MILHRVMPVITEEIASRFWSHVDISIPGACWNWTGGVFQDGYGSFWIGGGRNKGGKSYRAPRVAYAISNRCPGELKVCHICDNPLCCNPSHLWAGTSKQNSVDMCSKGRKPAGEMISALSNKDVQRIRESNESDRDIAKRFGIHQSTSSDIRRRKTWQHLKQTDMDIKAIKKRDEMSRFRKSRGENHWRSVLTEDKVRLILQESGSHSAIGRKFGVDRTTISLIRRRKTWGHINV